MEQDSILILGAGAAGLTAALVLSAAGMPVTILEARDRLGGRLHTVRSPHDSLPVELGAEFIHGQQVPTWDLVRLAGLPTHEVPDRHLHWSDGHLSDDASFWEELEQIQSRIDPAAPDQDFASFLNGLPGVSAQAKQLAQAYVEGFHAAQPDRMSIQALRQAERAAEHDEATRQFRITPGYGALIHWFEQRLAQRRVTIHLNHRATLVRWQPHEVVVETQTPTGPRTFNAPAAIITLPLGVLQQTGPEAVRFEPELREKQPAINGLAMGSVVKLTLQFRQPFWPEPNFGFIHLPEAPFPAWWADERGPVLTAWAGGPQADWVSRQNRESLLEQALTTLARIFQIQPSRVRELLLEHFTHDWARDPLSRGAYSYTPVGMTSMPHLLGTPVAHTLFFAGEATDAAGEQGTVHGALTSGRRAAREVLAALQLPARQHGVHCQP